MHIRFSSQLCEDVLSPEREKLRSGSETSCHVVKKQRKNFEEWKMQLVIICLSELLPKESFILHAIIVRVM